MIEILKVIVFWLALLFSVSMVTNLIKVATLKRGSTSTWLIYVVVTLWTCFYYLIIKGL